MIPSKDFPQTLFIVRSNSIKYKGYDFKNIPTSTGRADVLARIIIAALIEPNYINDSIGVWLFFNDAFFDELFDCLYNNHKIYPNEEINGKFQPFSVLITSKSPYFLNQMRIKKNFFSEYDILEALYNSFVGLYDNNYNNSIFTSINTDNLIQLSEDLIINGRNCFILEEDAPIDYVDHDISIKQLISGKSKKIAFFLGDQLGYDDKTQDGINKLIKSYPQQIKKISVGKNSLLSSSVVLLIKLKNLEE
ncbi:MAG: hypothetical protein GY870_09850 [archaeon]|nr:hypothetical protein [archaeon]